MVFFGESNARPVVSRRKRTSRRGIFTQLQVQLRFHQENQRRTRVLRRRRAADRVFAVERPAAPNIPRRRPEPVSKVGSEFWTGSGVDPRFGPFDCKDDSRVSFRLLIWWGNR